MAEESAIRWPETAYMAYQPTMSREQNRQKRACNTLLWNLNMLYMPTAEARVSTANSGHTLQPTVPSDDITQRLYSRATTIPPALTVPIWRQRHTMQSATAASK